MVSDTDLPHQSDTVQQRPQLIEKIGNITWKGFFITLAIFNVLWIIPTGSGIQISLFSLLIFNPNNNFFNLSPLALVGVLARFFPLAVIDFISVLVYRIKQHPKGKSLVLTYVFLFILSILLIFGGTSVFIWFWLLSFR